MSIAQNTLTHETMWKFIDRVLGPLGMTPDKASMDNGQVFRLYLELTRMGNSFLDTMQIQVLKNQLAYSHLEKLTN